MNQSKVNTGIFIVIIILIIVLYSRIQKESPFMQKTWIIPFEILSSIIVGTLIKLAFKKVQNG